MAKEIGSWTGDPVVKTIYGVVKGFEDERNTWTWKSIPYAKPPLGNLRWKALRDPEPWDGILEETEYCERCCEYDSRKKVLTGTEDCLRLNIWRPQSQEKDLPVYLWIHGGGNMFQGSLLKNTPGTGVASQSNMIFISFQYRLGEFGWLSHPALRSGKPGDEYDDSGNYGTLDIIKALTWIRDNIEAFGGNPNNVFISGQSGGSFDVLTMLISPAAKNLFHKAMVQSGRQNTFSVKEGDVNTDKIIAHLLVNDGTVTNLEEANKYRDNMSLEQIALYLRSKSFKEFYACRRDVPFVHGFEDGAVICKNGFNSLDDGTYPNKLPVIIGMNKEEAKLGLAQRNPFPDDDELYQAVADIASDMKKAYGCDNLLRRLRTNADQPEVYGYQFLWGWKGPSGKSPIPDPYGLLVGSPHGMEIPFFFSSFDQYEFWGNIDKSNVFTEENRKGREALSKATMAYIAGFIRNVHPNKPETNLPVWSPWTNDVGGLKCILFDVNGDDVDIKMTTEEITQTDVIAKLESLPEPLKTKVKTVGINHMTPIERDFIKENVSMKS
jgi:para-nitrobenzyl esterase